MANGTSQIKFGFEGIAHLLEDRSLAVPIYQRSYAWTTVEDNHVTDENDGLRWPHFDALKWPHLRRLLVSG